MTFSPGIVPVRVHFEAKRGFTFRAKVEFFKDTAKTEPLDLNSYTPKLEFEGYLTLETGNGGLVIGGAGGNVLEIVLTREQTEDAPSALHEFTFALEEETDAVPPFDGHFTFTKRIGA